MVMGSTDRLPAVRRADGPPARIDRPYEAPSPDDEFFFWLLLAAAAAVIVGVWYAAKWVIDSYKEHEALAVCCVSAALGLGVWIALRARQGSRRPRPALSALLRLARTFLLSLALVSAGFVTIEVVATRVDHTDAVVGRLIQVELGLRVLRIFADALVLSGWPALIPPLVLLAIAVPLSASPRGQQSATVSRVRRGLDRARLGLRAYSSAIGIAYGLLCLACAFTFFSNTLASAHWRIHARFATGWTLLEETAAQATALAVGESEEFAISALIDTAPPPLRGHAQALATVVESDARFMARCREAEERWRIDLSEREQSVRAESSGREARRTEQCRHLTAAAPTSPQPPKPSERLRARLSRLTIAELTRLRDSLGQLTQERRARYRRLAGSQEATLVLHQIVQLAHEPLDRVVEESLKGYPLVQAMGRVFTDALREVVQRHADRLATQLVDAALEPGAPNRHALVDAAVADTARDDAAAARAAWNATSNALAPPPSTSRLADLDSRVAGADAELSVRCAGRAAEIAAERADLMPELRRIAVALPGRFGDRPTPPQEFFQIGSSLLREGEADATFSSAPRLTDLDVLDLREHGDPIPPMFGGFGRDKPPRRSPVLSPRPQAGTYFRRDVRRVTVSIVAYFEHTQDSVDLIEQLRRVVKAARAGPSDKDSAASFDRLQAAVPFAYTRIERHTLAELQAHYEAIRAHHTQLQREEQVKREARSSEQLRSLERLNRKPERDQWEAEPREPRRIEPRLP